MIHGKTATINVTADGPTGGTDVPSAPGNLTASDRGETLILTWDVATSASAQILRYEIRVGSSGNPWHRTRNARPRWSYTGQDPGESIAYYVRAANKFGPGPNSSIEVGVARLSNTIPGSVRNFTATRIGGSDSRQYRLNWTKPSNITSNDPVRRSAGSPVKTRFIGVLGCRCTPI